MRYHCPNCADVRETEVADETEPVRCPLCSARMRPTPDGSPATPDPGETGAERPAIPARNRPPASLTQAAPLRVGTRPSDYEEEEIEDLRDRRDHRREERQHVREDRASNMTGAIGLAVNATALVLLISGGLFANQLKVYAWFVTLLAVPMVLTGLPCSFIGALRIGHPHAFSWVGVGLGLLLLLVLIPLMFLKVL